MDDLSEWSGTPPTHCDLCKNPIGEIFIDGAVYIEGVSIWACVCPSCHEFSGTGLGEGHGQKYQKQGSTFVKVEG